MILNTCCKILNRESYLRLRKTSHKTLRRCIRSYNHESWIYILRFDKHMVWGGSWTIEPRLVTILWVFLSIIHCYYPTSLRGVQITPKTSTNITRYLYSRGPVRQVFSQRASDEFDSSYENNFCLSKGISFLRFFLTEISKWKTWIDL